MLTVVSPADKFPSSVAFDAINEALNASDADRKDAIKQGNGVYAFTLKNQAGETESWHIDLKEKGAVGKGTGEKPNGRFLLASIRANYVLSASPAIAVSLLLAAWGWKYPAAETEWFCFGSVVRRKKRVANFCVPCSVSLSLSESDFGQLVSGKANAQRLFMSGKLKIKGDVMKATKLDPIMKKAQTKAKL